MQKALSALKCKCGDIFISSKSFCIICNSKPESFNIEPRGTILSFTNLYVTPAGFDPPHFIALVELEDGSIIMCNTQSERTFKIGEKVKLSITNEKWMIID